MASIKLVPFEEELKKNPELKESDIEILRQWCRKQPHLPKMTDSELALFLHSNYYRLEPTKSTIDTFFTVRTHVPEFFHNRDPINNQELKKTINVAIFFTKSFRVFYMHTTNDTLEKFIPLEVLPNEAGGQAGLIQELRDKQVKKLIDHITWFKEEEANHRVNELLRPDKAKTATDLFGVEGSFKKLDID
ncbi:hypothetical protein ALC62_11115 [Cyphomyrmex costatus]|uniref:Alpha-tocopherol transfer protein-like protein n=1 Tax=Cyphomyrmex costatus TaxID=456900 RepID=A0A195CBQ2_9HYME|nr:hypothetical protein ALC62_11115 [Cyphomyrmex costatus]